MIESVNLKRVTQKNEDEIIESVNRVIKSGWYLQGSENKTFEKNYAQFIGTNYCIGVGNGLDALRLILRAYINLGIMQPGDEIIVPANTYIATILSITDNELIPVLIEPDINTYQIDSTKIRAAITNRTKGIMIVHLYGQCSYNKEIGDICKTYNLKLIEDNAQAICAEFHFSDGKIAKSGTIGDIGCTSFFPSKNLGCYGDGGALFTNSDALAEKLSYIVNHGMKRRYYHDYIGVNSRLDTLQAAILKVKLQYLDDYIAARQKAADYYDKAFTIEPKLKIPQRFAKSSHVFHQYTLQAIDFSRDELIDFLKEKQIPAMIYYPVPIHLQKAYQHYVKAGENYPISEHLSKVVFSLPMHTELDEEQLEYITNSVLEFLNK